MLINIKKQLQTLIPTFLHQSFNKQFCIFIPAEYLEIGLQFLKNHVGYQYKLLSCISAVDLLLDTYRFNIAYELLSLTFNSRLRVKIIFDEYFFVPSILNIYINANWWEREIWDLYGIFFDNHSDLRRILTDYSFEGHPMRKDFPLSGFYEARYNNTLKCVVFEEIQFLQEYRLFNFSN